MFRSFSRCNVGALFLFLVLSGAASAEPWRIMQSSGPVWFGSNAAQLVSLGSATTIAGGATVVTGDGGRAMLVRGEDRYGHFDLIDPPGGERDAAALAAHQEVSDRYRENYRQQVERHEQRFVHASSPT